MTQMNHRALTNCHLSTPVPRPQMGRYGGLLTRLVTDLRFRPRWMTGREIAARLREHELAELGAPSGDAFAKNALVLATLFWPVPPC
jgi:hypothetical protein